MTVQRTLLLGDSLTDVRTLDGMRVLSIGNLRAPGTRKGSDIEVPRGNGVIPVTGRGYDQYSFSIQVRILGDTAEDFEANLDAICAAVIAIDGDLGTRRVPATGSPGYIDRRTLIRFNAGMAFDCLNGVTGKTELQWVNLKGAWTSEDDPATATTWVL